MAWDSKVKHVFATNRSSSNIKKWRKLIFPAQDDECQGPLHINLSALESWPIVQDFLPAECSDEARTSDIESVSIAVMLPHNWPGDLV